MGIDTKLHKYLEVRGGMQTGDLVEWSGNTILGWAIRKFTGRKVSHSAIVLRIAEYCGLKDRRFVLEATSHGITLNLLSHRLADYSGKVYWSALKSEFNKHRNPMGEWALLMAGHYKKGEKVRYDYKSLLLNALGPVSVNARQLFCSEYYHAALIAAGIVQEGGNAARPGDFIDMNVHQPEIRIL